MMQADIPPHCVKFNFIYLRSSQNIALVHHSADVPDVLIKINRRFQQKTPKIIDRSGCRACRLGEHSI